MIIITYWNAYTPDKLNCGGSYRGMLFQQLANTEARDDRLSFDVD